jgi:hypothetical protein
MSHLMFRLVPLLLLSLPSYAADPAPDAPPPPPMVDGREELEPQVTIIQREKETVEEYRINNRLYMVKITPRKGRPYYLVDSDGDGLLEARQDSLDPQLAIPSWVLFRW